MNFYKYLKYRIFENLYTVLHHHKCLFTLYVLKQFSKFCEYILKHNTSFFNIYLCTIVKNTKISVAYYQIKCCFVHAFNENTVSDLLWAISVKLLITLNSNTILIYTKWKWNFCNIYLSYSIWNLNIVIYYRHQASLSPIIVA